MPPSRRRRLFKAKAKNAVAFILFDYIVSVDGGGGGGSFHSLRFGRSLVAASQLVSQSVSRMEFCNWRLHFHFQTSATIGRLERQSDSSTADTEPDLPLPTLEPRRKLTNEKQAKQRNTKATNCGFQRQ